MLFTILCILNYVAFVSKMEYLCKLFMAPYVYKVWLLLVRKSVDGVFHGTIVVFFTFLCFQYILPVSWTQNINYLFGLFVSDKTGNAYILILFFYKYCIIKFKYHFIKLLCIYNIYIGLE